GLLRDNAGTVQVNGQIGSSLVNTGAVLQVDGIAADVNLAGGTLAGTGQVGNIDAGSAGTIPVGTIDPGDTPAPTTGIVTTNPGGTKEQWGTGTRFHVDLNDASQGPGTGYDQLVVNGDLDLGGVPIS